MKPIALHPVSILVGASGCAAAFFLSSMVQLNGHAELLITAEQREILGHLSIQYLDDGVGGLAKTIRATGVNLQVVNGIGSTESVNGVGNLIIGYQEPGNELDPDARTGSHCLVVGRRNNYTSFAGVVVGESNVASGTYACISSGRRNRASGPWSAVAGGVFNAATSVEAVVVGGAFNWANAGGGVVLGGSGNQVQPAGDGGAGSAAVVVGGFDNRSKGQASVVVGGRYNETTANYSAILAGTNNRCFGDAGGGGSFCAVVGGEGNSTAITTAATVGGGENRTAVGDHDWVAGSLFEDN